MLREVQVCPLLTIVSWSYNSRYTYQCRQVISKSSLCAWSQVGNSCQIRPRVLVEAEIMLQ